MPFEELSLRKRVFLSQLPFAVSVGVVFVACLFLRPEQVMRDVQFLFGVGLTAILTVLAIAVPWHRLPRVAYWSIPVLDFVATAPIWGFARFLLDGMVLLAAYPVIWLAWSGLYPRLAILLGVLGSTAVTWWPYLADLSEMTPQQLLRPSLVPLFMFTLSYTASVITSSMERQQEQLAGVLSTSSQQNRMLHAVLETSPVGIVVTDRHGNDKIMNTAQRRTHLAGLPSGSDDGSEAELRLYEVDGRTPIPPPDRPVRRAVLGDSFEGRLLVIGDPPSQQTLSVSASAMHDEHGEFDGTVVIFQDVTELMQAIEARERFIADISHEFRTPLTSIIGYLELARDEEIDTVLGSYLSTIHRNAERLLVLVSQLLDAAADSTELAVRRTDLVRQLRHAVQSAAVRADSGEIALTTDLPESLSVALDRLRISQVIDNLISNAIKYTPAGGSVVVSARRDGDCAEFSIRDTGVGMTPDEQEQVFASFYRTEEVRRTAIPGTGLGLSITQRLVEAHGGAITVESEVGVGSTFTVRLPLEGPRAEDAC